MPPESAEKNLFALLVGINRYAGALTALQGCVRDVTRFHEMLAARVPHERLHALLLTDERATRQAVVEGFRNHLSRAERDDVILFYYSGHGSQVDAPDEARDESPFNQTLVCHDSRAGDQNRDLVDKELAWLISELDPIGAHVVVILDSCHSGTATRDTEAVVRRVATDPRPRPFDSYDVIPPAARAALRQAGAAGSGSSFRRMPRGSHVVISACLPEQLAGERQFEEADGAMGVFTFYLLRALARSDAPSYFDLWNEVVTRVQRLIADQKPMFEDAGEGLLRQPFLGGAIRPKAPVYKVSSIDGTLWKVDGGALHGFTTGVENDRFQLALFPADHKFPVVEGATTIQGVDLRDSVGVAIVERVEPGESVVSLTLNSGAAPDHFAAPIFQAVVINRPLVPYRVRIETDPGRPAFDGRPARPAGAPDAVERLHALMAGGGRAAGAGNGAPDTLILQVREAAAGESADFVATVFSDHYSLRRDGGNFPLVVTVPGTGVKAAMEALEKLEHMGRWQQTHDLQNPQTAIAADAIRIEIVEIDLEGKAKSPPLNAGEMRQVVRQVTHRGAIFQASLWGIRLTNTVRLPYHVAVLSLDDAYSANMVADPFKLEAGADKMLMMGADFPLALLDKGVTEFRTVIKFLISTEPIIPMMVLLDPLEVGLNSGMRAAPPARQATNPLEKLFADIHNSRSGFEFRPASQMPDWTMKMVTVTSVRPNAPEPVPQRDSAPLALNDQLIIHPHPALLANARLGEEAVAAKSDGQPLQPTLPALFRDNPGISEPYAFGGARDGSAGRNVLQLSEIRNPEAVSPDLPLRLTMPDRLMSAKEEVLIPCAFDAAINGFIIAGKAVRDHDRADGMMDVLIQTLPSGSTKDPVTATKILFRKLVLRPLGFTFDFPRLVRLRRNPDLTLRTVMRDLKNEPVALAEQVRNSRKILLYVHGWTGDTDSMVPSAFFHDAGALADRYDLVLAFDYESIHTSIKTTARDLKRMLEAVGLGAGHGRTLHVVAHSMGGLVARWFIEREGGRDIVQHLVMLGTPNGGLPWPEFQAMATYGATLLLNTVGRVDWISHALSGLAAGIEAVDVTVDEMENGSEFYRELNSSEDPHVQYTCIGGNVSTIPELPRDHAVKQRAFAALGLAGDAFDVARKIVFNDTANDLFISVESVHDIPAAYTPAPRRVEVAANHLNYFAVEPAIAALREALG